MYDNIPIELRNLDQWVCWKMGNRDDSVTKVPLDPNANSRARVNDSRTWSSFDVARRRMQKDGVGFVLTRNDAFVGIDLDGCVVNGMLSAKAHEIVSHFDSYTELSPSETGLHIFIKAHLDQSLKVTEGSESVELYGEGRYLTMTGHRLSRTPTVIHQRQEELDAFLAKFDKTQLAPPTVRSTATLADDQVLQRASNAKNGAKFRRLWMGDISHHNCDHSGADLALCNMLWYWCRDADQVDRLFRQSRLMREKWDSPRGSSTYGANVILKAMGS